MSEALVIFSGGQDSTTCLYWALEKYNLVHTITFQYGQRHDIELQCATRICKQEGVPQKVINIDFLREIADSALLDIASPIAKENAKNLPASFVPNRNQLFITLAHSYAQKLGIKVLITGVCQTDYSGYPDCRAEFIDAIEKATNLGSDENIEIMAPLMYMSKAAIFRTAAALGKLQEVIELSHTCYEGNHTDLHSWGYGCGVCPACKLRQKGYEEYLDL